MSDTVAAAPGSSFLAAPVRGEITSSSDPGGTSTSAIPKGQRSGRRYDHEDETPITADVRAAAGVLWTIRSRGTDLREALQLLPPDQRGLAQAYQSKMRARARVRTRRALAGQPASACHAPTGADAPARSRRASRPILDPAQTPVKRCRRTIAPRQRIRASPAGTPCELPMAGDAGPVVWLKVMAHAVALRPARLAREFTSRTRVRHAIAVAVSAVSLLVLAVQFARPLLGPTLVDFANFHASAESATDGRTLYACSLKWRDAEYSWFRPGQAAPCAASEPLYMYPPAFAVAIAPVAAMSRPTAELGWHLASFVMLATAMFVLTRALIPGTLVRSMLVALVLTALAALFQPVRISLALGQSDTLVLLLLALSLAAVVRGGERASGAWLGLAILVKPFLAAVIILYLWQRSYRAALAASVVAAAGLLVGFVIVGVDSIPDYVAGMRYFSGPVGGASPINSSAYGLLTRSLIRNDFTTPVANLPALHGALWYLFVAAILGATLWATGRVRSDDPYTRACAFGVATLGALLISPFSESWHYSYAIIPVVALACAYYFRPGIVRGPWFPLILLGVLTYLSLPGLERAKWAFWRFNEAPLELSSIVLTGVHLYGLCALFILGALTVRTLRRYAGASTAAVRITRPSPLKVPRTAPRIGA